MGNLIASAALVVARAFAVSPARGQPSADAGADEATRAALQRYRTADDPAEAKRAFDELRNRAATSPSAIAAGPASPSKQTLRPPRSPKTAGQRA